MGRARQGEASAVRRGDTARRGVQGELGAEGTAWLGGERNKEEMAL